MIVGPGAAAGHTRAAHSMFRIARRYFEVKGSHAEEHRSAPKSNARRKNPCGAERGPSKEQAA